MKKSRSRSRLVTVIVRGTRFRVHPRNVTATLAADFRLTREDWDANRVD